MSESINVVCPHCNAVNRVPQAKLGAGPKCGKCKSPVLTGVPLDLTAANFQQFIGRNGLPVVVDFWASWCEPCKRSFPWMNELQALYGEDGFEIIAVNLDTSRKDADEFLKQMPAKFDVAFDKSGKTAEAYNLKAMPSSFLIDRKGRLVHKSLGYRVEEKKIVEKKIQQLLGKQVAANR